MSHSCPEDNEGPANFQEAPQTQQVGSEISGYPKLALHMSRFPESAVLRRFKELNIGICVACRSLSFEVDLLIMVRIAADDNDDEAVLLEKEE